MEKKIRECSYRFGNGVVVINTTPHGLTFQDIDGTKVIVPKTGDLVVNARASKNKVSKYLVKTVFEANEDGQAIIDAIKSVYGDGEEVMIVGSMIAAQAYPGQIVGIVPVPGFERVPPEDKLMRCDEFTVF